MKKNNNIWFEAQTNDDTSVAFHKSFNTKKCYINIRTTKNNSRNIILSNV